MKYLVCVIVVSLAGLTGVSAQETAFQGKWKLIKEMSSNLDYFQYMTVEFTLKQGEVAVTKEFGPKRRSVETMVLPTNGTKKSVAVKDRTFMSNLYMGIKIPSGATKVSHGNLGEGECAGDS